MSTRTGNSAMRLVGLCLLALSAMQSRASAIEPGDVVIVTEEIDVRDGRKVIDRAHPGYVYRVEEVRENGWFRGEKYGTKEKGGWITTSAVEEYEGTVRQKLLFQKSVSAARRIRYPGMHLEYIDVNVFEIPVEIDGRTHFVPIAEAQVRGRYPEHPRQGSFEFYIVFAVKGKHSIPAPETVFYSPGVIVDPTVAQDVDASLTPLVGSLKLPLSE